MKNSEAQKDSVKGWAENVPFFFCPDLVLFHYYLSQFLLYPLDEFR
jgi:hypothetical protein